MPYHPEFVLAKICYPYRSIRRTRHLIQYKHPVRISEKLANVRPSSSLITPPPDPVSCTAAFLFFVPFRISDTFRLHVISDRLEASASAQRGGGSVGSYASIDRRSLMQDVVVLRDTLAETKPDEARRLAEGLFL